MSAVSPPIDGLILATFFAGLILVAIGFLRLGTFIKYIPYPVTVGFTCGIAIIIFASQIKELAGLNVGGMTKPRVVETGVSMLAVCAKSVAEDTTFVKGNLRAEAGNAAMKGEVEAYLKELRDKAKIIYE